jgi:hypothetical protein
VPLASAPGQPNWQPFGVIRGASACLVVVLRCSSASLVSVDLNDLQSRRTETDCRIGIPMNLVGLCIAGRSDCLLWPAGRLECGRHFLEADGLTTNAEPYPSKIPPAAGQEPSLLQQPPSCQALVPAQEQPSALVVERTEPVVGGGVVSRTYACEATVDSWLTSMSGSAPNRGGWF